MAEPGSQAEANAASEAGAFSPLRYSLFRWLWIAALASTMLPPLVALGFVYLGVLPSTVQSATSYTSLAHGNVALAVVGAALINIAGVFISAPLFALLDSPTVGGARLEQRFSIKSPTIVEGLLDPVVRGLGTSRMDSKALSLYTKDKSPARSMGASAGLPVQV